jgi:hypothetical protein
MTTAARNARAGLCPFAGFYRKPAAIPDTQSVRGSRVRIAFVHFD